MLEPPSAYVVDMKKSSKFVQLPPPENRIIASDEPSWRIILRIGKRRLAFDFFTRITELAPTTGDRPAPVIPTKPFP